MGQGQAMAPATELDDGTKEHVLMGGRVRLREGSRGYRAGMDAVLLAAACDARPDDRVLDAGCGAGAVLLMVAARRPGVRLFGVERDPAALQRAQANIALNGLAERAEAFPGDAAAPFSRLGQPAFDAVLANPPFFDDPAVLRAPAAERREAWITLEGLPAWLAFLGKAVREGGSVTIVHRADRMADLLAGLAPAVGSLQIRPISPFADAPAKRVIVRGLKTGKAPLRLLPPLVLHPSDGSVKHTPQAEAILRGEAELAWER